MPEKILDIFWSIHNPTTPNRQGPDVGSQYRSEIFYHSPEQKKIAESSKEIMEKSGKFTDDIVTRITRLRSSMWQKSTIKNIFKNRVEFRF